MSWRKRRGSVITEAAMIFPLAILAVVSVVVILTVFHQQAGIKAQLHQSVRGAAGAAAGVWHGTDWREEGSLYQGAVYGNLFGAGDIADHGEVVLRDKMKAKELLPVGYQGEFVYRHHPLFPEVKGTVSGVFGGSFLLKRQEAAANTSSYAVDEAQLLRNLQYALEKGASWLESTETNTGKTE